MLWVKGKEKGKKEKERGKEIAETVGSRDT